MSRDPSLARKLARANRRRRLAAAALVAPLFLFLFVAFVVPIGSILFQSVENTDVSRFMPRTAEAVRGWEGTGVPDEPVFEALVADLAQGYEAKTIARAATSLNHQRAGFRSLVMGAARRADRLEPPYREALEALDPAWTEPETWTVIERAARPITDRYLLAAVDLERNADGDIVQAPENRRIYIDYLLRTVWISLVVTLLCLLLGFPMAQLIASASGAWRRALFILVLLPFWTSLLVRTAAWVILLQRNGAVNETLMQLGLIDTPLELIFNRFGVYVAMTHVLLPFMILPIYSVMRGIPRDHLRASASLGARPLATFLSVYLPQTLPGVGAGCLLVWVLAIGFYITPALVGGGGDQMLSFLIAEFTLRTANWHMAAALAIVLLLMVALLYPIIMRLTGANRVEPGR
jgi:putative spermidine/putrescine transport system permease protein